MQERGINAYELARATRVQQPTIHRIVAQEVKNPWRSSLEPIANYFRVTVDSLYESETQEVSAELSEADELFDMLMTLNEDQLAAVKRLLKAFDHR